MNPADGHIQAVASAINVTKPDEILWEHWVGALRSGAYKFGYGVLRTGDDEYDPFGVLAAISLAEWTWDDNEASWATAGDATFIKPSQMAEWLGIRSHEDLVRAGILTHVEALQSTVLNFADSVDSFEPIAVLLVEGMRRAKAEQDRLARARLQGRAIDRYVGDIREDSYMIAASRSPYRY